MKGLALAFFAFLLVFASARLVKKYQDEEGRSLQHHEGKELVTDSNGVEHVVAFNLHLLDEPHLTFLDDNDKILAIECDVDNTEMIVHFTNSYAANTFVKKLDSELKDKKFDSYVTGTDKWGCQNKHDVSSYVMRKVLGATKLDDSQSVKLLTDMAHYDQLVKDGDITVDRDDEFSRTHGKSKLFCLGYNTDADCDDASASIPLYKNKYFDIECSDCFVGAKVYAFMELSFHLFGTKKVAAGLKGMEINAALELDMDARYQWNAGVDKLFDVVKHATILQFSIGPLPINIWFELPIHLKADANFHAAAHATAGAKAKYYIGDAYVEWKSGHWHVHKPQPKFTWNPVLKGDASFHGDAELSIIPEFKMHIDNVLSSAITIDPRLYLNIDGDLHKKQMCADLKYSVLAQFYAELEMNIPWTWIHIDKKFGPDNIIQTGIQPIGHYCYPHQ
eukprot:TRINITY_DN1101_c0_g1_i1.p1 TRINITY_DN1101_c0_g1~~TRINITY_DN1101_c0_g1_i1.p1  ORF type:complete len:448 (+),score=79.49 TRINITY_DN1101_c0_g1_i1:2-1345(+)